MSGHSVSEGAMRLGGRAPLVDGAPVPGASGSGSGSGVAVPGFLDLHINGLVGVDFLSTDLDGYRAAGVALAGHGVVGYLPTFITSPLEDYAPALAVAGEAAEQLVGIGARVLGVHLEGPYLSPHWP